MQIPTIEYLDKNHEYDKNVKIQNAKLQNSENEKYRYALKIKSHQRQLYNSINAKDGANEIIRSKSVNQIYTILRCQNYNTDK